MFPYRFRLLLSSFVLLVSCAIASAQQINYTVYDSLAQIKARINQAGSTTLVINFWATWCKPCVDELPFLEELQQRYAKQNVKVLLVSLDFKSQLEKRFLPFLKERHLNSEVILFADQDANTWIPQIHEAWDGAIPATLVLQGQTKMFHLGKFEDFEDLEMFVQPFLGAIDSPAGATSRK